ncbi:B3 domain-containing transcription factor VRN1 isoform X2 [Vigna angularis]|uniref:B3 domain-containing transcription factor VRN1 isoform X2 n=1 Tax=Phaseolus angularis TaxID=3914 RepID=UPI000809F485|nr:B3 domain-containing transcription factor VRN1 isoform X2 [Vigna angularis]
MASHLGQISATLPIHFFKIILETNIERIKVPSKFTRKHGSFLPNPVSLRPPDSKEWVVYWTQENGEVWLDKGWKEFVENYSLSYGYFVMFKFKGTSQIDVTILDPSAVELDYFSSGKESVNTMNVTQMEQEPRPMSSMVPSQPCGKTQNVERDANVQQQVYADKGGPSHQGTNVQKIIKQQPNWVKSTLSGKCLNKPRSLKAQKITKNFKSKYPYFTSLIVQAKLEENATKHVPKFLNCMRGQKDVMLQMENREWWVKLICCREKYDVFSSGWSKFAKESNLEVDDVCIFELIDPAIPMLRVHVVKS